MATPKGTRTQRFLLRSGDAVHIHSNSQSITLQRRHEVPAEVDLAGTSFKAALALAPGASLAIAGELLTAAAAQLLSNGWASPPLSEALPLLHWVARSLSDGARSPSSGLRHDVGRDIGHAIEPVPIPAVFPETA